MSDEEGPMNGGKYLGLEQAADIVDAQRAYAEEMEGSYE